MTPLKNQAIQTALQGDWETAISLNLKLLKENPDDVEALNRLAFAYTVLQKPQDAKNTYQKVLKLDSQNPIALRNLKRITTNTGKVTSAARVGNIAHAMDSLFIEESGKTKVIDLINVAQPHILTRLVPGEVVNLRIKRLKIFVLSEKGQYIGMMPDDIGKRMIKFLKAGCAYEAYIKYTTSRTATIFIKETKRSLRYKNQPTFISGEKTKIPFPNKLTYQSKDLEELEDES